MNIAIETVQRRLKDLDMIPKKPAKKTFLTKLSSTQTK